MGKWQINIKNEEIKIKEHKDMNYLGCVVDKKCWVKHWLLE